MEKLDINSFTKEQAEAYIAELQDIELDAETLSEVAGGGGLTLKPSCSSKKAFHAYN
ncbi:MAG: hypothetical protein J6W62_05960 [Spirochaetia bacterium]|nr:hypothetical protein [Spirochaetia bacterium]MBO7430892.1 hypothetical protein [Spirochaetia bacterium]